MKKVINLACLALVSVALYAQDASNPPAANPPAAKAPSPPVSETPSSGPNVPSDYIIGADDTLHITVWKEPDMSSSLPVRPDGKISIPLLDDVQAAGMTPMQLANSIKEKLKKYIADPRVTVVVTAMNSQRDFVLGEVVHSGPTALLPHMTVLQALSSAGFTQFSNLKAIYLLRVQHGQQTKLPFNSREALKGRRMQ